MTIPNATKTPKADANSPLLQKIPAVVKELITLGDLLNRHLNANSEDRKQIAAEIDQITDRVVYALHDKATPPEVQIIFGTPPNLYTIRLMALLLRESLIDVSGLYFTALAATAQLGQSEAFLPTMVAIAELKVTGFVEDHEGWIRVASSFLQDIVHIPLWLAPQFQALVGHNHKISDGPL